MTTSNKQKAHGSYIIKGRTILFDLEMKPLLDKYKWNIQVRSTGSYAITFGYIGKKQYTFLMHRLLTGTKAMHVDHINGNGLDNRSSNLRFATMTQNMGNRKKQRSKASSIYKGVSWNKSHNKWSAQCAGNYLGSFRYQVEAARAYNKFAKKYFGEYAKINTLASLGESEVGERDE